VPDAARLFFDTPRWRNFFENTLTVQFDHRMVAYALWLVAVLHAADVARTLRGGRPLTGALTLTGVITLQAALASSRCSPGAARLGLDASGHGDGRAHNCGRACARFAPIFRPAPMREVTGDTAMRGQEQPT